MADYIDAAEAARRLGVSRQSLYAYVSRGLIKAAPAEQVIRCEECQRILVRTAESGL